MKLHSVTIQGFRAFGTKVRLEFGNTNIIGGPNGFGKSSLFDAIEWCLFGNIRRLSGTRDFSRAGDVLSNKFFSGPCSVAIEFVDKSRKNLYRARTSNTVSSKINGERVDDEEFLGLLGLGDSDRQSGFLRYFILQQERVAEFVRDLNPRGRYDSLVSLLELSTPQRLVEQIRELDLATQSLHNQLSNHLTPIEQQIEKRRKQSSDLKAEIEAVPGDSVWSLKPGHPSHSGPNRRLTAIGIETCYRLFDLGLSSLAVAYLMVLSPRSAGHRRRLWEEAGGLERQRQELPQLE